MYNMKIDNRVIIVWKSGPHDSLTISHFEFQLDTVHRLIRDISFGFPRIEQRTLNTKEITTINTKILFKLVVLTSLTRAVDNDHF